MDDDEFYELEAKMLARRDALDAARYAKKGMPVPYTSGAQQMQNAMTGTNIGMPDAAFKTPPRYFHPGQFNAAGWTNKKGETFITQPDDLSIANVVAHEALHSRANTMMGGGMPEPANDIDRAARQQLAYNMDQIQPPARIAGPFWGLNPNRYAEEQIANIAGYEGALPAGTPITKSLVADKLFQGSLLGVNPQQVKDYYFGQSSLPYKGVWEGQVKDPSTLTRAMSTLKRLATRVGINTERFNNPNE